MPVIYGCHLPKTLCNNHCVSALPTWRTMNKDAKWKAMPTGHLLHLPANLRQLLICQLTNTTTIYMINRLIASFQLFLLIIILYSILHRLVPTPHLHIGTVLRQLQRILCLGSGDVPKNNREALFENCNFPCSLITHPFGKARLPRAATSVAGAPCCDSHKLMAL